jgi:hypothetical protein
MLRSTLQQTHDSYDADLWADYDALYAGGKKFFARIGRFLHQNPVEPSAVYASRKKEANYRCYLGGIIDYFASFLFGSSLIMRAKRDGKDIKPDPFYAAFKEDCDGDDNDIHLFLRLRVIEALTKRCAWWLVEMPPAPPDGDPAAEKPTSLAEWKDKGLDKGRVRAISADQLLDWEVDDDGHLVWAIVLSVKVVRPKPTDLREMVIERYDVYDRETVERFELVYDKRKRPAKNIDVPSKGKRPHGFSRVPLVSVDCGEALWLANRVASPQLEHFRLSCAQGWGIRRTCYAMPVFNLEDQTKPPVMGAGYYIMLGLKEKMEWGSPPATPYEAIATEVKSQKDEIYRVVHQMAMGVDNNAAAVGRSAESKEIDSAAVRVVLEALGKIVRESVERTYDLLSEARGDDHEWAVSGLDNFANASLSDLVAAALGITTVDIPSPTFHREWAKRLAGAAVPDVDQSVKDTIAKEIDANITDESVLAPPVVPGQNPKDDAPDDDQEPGSNGAGRARGGAGAGQQTGT